MGAAPANGFERLERARLIISMLPLPLASMLAPPPARKARGANDSDGGMAERLLRSVAGRRGRRLGSRSR